LNTQKEEIMADIPAQTGNAQAANWEAQMNIEGLKLPRRIGVCINYGAHIWYQLQSATERDLATQLGIELEAIDANMDADLQARQVERFLEQDVDVLIYSAVNPTLAPGVLKQVHKAGVPVITESIWVDSPAVATNVMINDYKGGPKIGRVAASWIKEHSQGPVKVLDVTAPWLPEGLQRSDGFLAGLREEVPEFETIRLDGRADIKTSAEVVAEFCGATPPIR
jgi:ribose transport system substrate-binding protein